MRLRKIRRTAYIAMILLLVSLVVLMAVSYAWLVMASAPEVSGLDTNIGANGSLEIALVSAGTYMDPGGIQTAIGSSMVNKDAIYANQFWGNVVDLSDTHYGLDRITMLPACLDVIPGEDGGCSVGTNLLMVPSFGADGRLEKFNSDMVSGAFSGSAFTYYSDYQRYGVRGIGTISNVSPRQVALIHARSSVASCQSSAVSAMETVWRSNGTELLDIVYCLYAQNQISDFGDAELAVLRDTAVRMLGVLDYVDTALRQGVIGYAAMYAASDAEFALLRDTLENKALPISQALRMSPVALPEGVTDAVALLEADQISMKQLIGSCDRLEGKPLDDTQMELLVSQLFHPDTSFLGEVSLSNAGGQTELAGETILSLYGVKNPMGTMQNIVKYAGEYQAIFDYTPGVAVRVETVSSGETYLGMVRKMLDEGSVAEDTAEAWEVALNETFGYAVDMAFRCNVESNLLLQTFAAQRIEQESETAETQGSGSYMRFSSEQLNTEQIVLMMDAIRIGFLDNQNRLLGLAKLNTSNYREADGEVTAPLYMYDFSVSADGSISMGERRSANSAVTSLPANSATVLTIVVWLDGDHVSNSLASYTARSISGLLNLQFASDADLVASDQSVNHRD